jgi:hypothetical protein
MPPYWGKTGPESDFPDRKLSSWAISLILGVNVDRVGAF